MIQLIGLTCRFLNNIAIPRRPGWLQRLIFCVALVTTPTAFGASDENQQNSRDRLGTWNLLGEAQELSEIATTVVRHSLPERYENLKEWGQTKGVWDGLSVSLDDGQIKTKRRWKKVHHGSWKMYHFWPINPQQELHVRVLNLRETEPGRAGADLEIVMRVGTFGRWSEWRRGVQLFSVSADAEANIRLSMSCEVGSKLDLNSFPPDLVLQPAVKRAQLELLDFRLIQLSDLKGVVARELGDALEGVLRAEIRDQETKLVNRINHQIARHADKLRLSGAALSGIGDSKTASALK